MLLAIAILSLIGVVGGVIFDIIKGHTDDREPGGHLILFSIAVISWWEITIVMSIVLICLAVIWTFIILVAKYG